MLDPGDRARPHRHTGAAIRFATRAEGAATIVNGRRCEMKAGDLILTPPMCWHGHINESDHRIIWFDAANMPLIRAVDAISSSRAIRETNEFWQVDEGEEKLWTEAGLVGAEAPTPAPVTLAEISLSGRGDAAAAGGGCRPAPTARAPCATSIRRPAAR